MHVSGSAGVHHPGVALQRHLLQSSHKASHVPLRLAAGLLRSNRSVGLGSRPEKSRATALLSTATRALAAAAEAARLTLLTPWIDANPGSIRVGRAWLLRLLAAAAALAVVVPLPPLLATAAAAALLLLLRQELLRRRRHGGAAGGPAAGGAAAGGRGGVESGGGDQLGLLGQAQLLEGKAIKGAGEGDVGVISDDVAAGGAEARIGATEQVEHHHRVIDGSADVTKAISSLLHLLAVGFDGQIPLSQGHEGLTQEDSTGCPIRPEAGSDAGPKLVCRRVRLHDEVVNGVGDGAVDPGTDAAVLLNPQRGEGIGRCCPVDVRHQGESAAQSLEARLPLGEVVGAEVKLHRDVGVHVDRGVRERHGRINLCSRVVAEEKRKPDGAIGIAVTGVHVGDGGH